VDVPPASKLNVKNKAVRAVPGASRKGVSPKHRENAPISKTPMATEDPECFVTSLSTRGPASTTPRSKAAKMAPLTGLDTPAACGDFGKKGEKRDVATHCRSMTVQPATSKPVFFFSSSSSEPEAVVVAGEGEEEERQGASAKSSEAEGEEEPGWRRGWATSMFFCML